MSKEPELYEREQTFQIGDVCRIVHTDNTFRHPVISDEKAWEVGLTILVAGSYWQTCGCCRDLKDYVVIVPAHLNPDRYDEKGCYHDQEKWYHGEFSWAWVRESQMEFVRKPTDEERTKAIAVYRSWTRDQNIKL